MTPPVLRRVPSADGVVSLATFDYGGTGANVLFLHGNGLHVRAFDPMLRQLRRAGFRVVGLDQRGAGASTLPEGAACARSALHGGSHKRFSLPGGADLHWQRMGDDVLAVQDALGLRGCLGCGHSLGGCALLLAEAKREEETRKAIMEARTAAEAETLRKVQEEADREVRMSGG